jgi:Iap family predicted aminopeptidase
VVFEPSEPGATEIGRFMVNVVGQCGCRVAGSPGEDQAADLISSEMTRIGLQDVKTLHFPIHAWEPGHSTLEVCVGGQWETAASMPVAHSPSTEGRILQGRAVHIESMADLGKLRSPAGTVAVLWDGYGESLAEFRRLMDCRFAAIILVDKRFAHGDVVAEGVAALWIPHFKTPMITVPHPQMVRLFGHGPVDCRLSVGGCVRPGRSSVVSGEIPGRRPDAILLCGHHDTTANSAAPDDNLSGVATVLRVAAILTERGLRPWHTIRFCSFGAEEQLSEGARWYALESGHGAEVRFVLNTDSAGARCGTTGVHVTGGDDLVAWIRDEAGRSDLQLKIIPEVCPFSDQFPLNCCGVPSVWFYRQTMTAGRHFHHTIRDTLSEISFDQLARLAEYQAQLVQRLAGRTTWPFHPRLPAKAARAVAVAGQNWFGSAVGQSQHQKNKDS